MATTQKTKTAAAPDPSTAGSPKESAEQDSAPVPANTTGASVPEVKEAMGEGEPETEEAEAVEPPKKYVVWKDAQHFEIRTFTPQDWAKAGVENGRTLHWYKGNDFRVPLDDVSAFLTEDQIQRFILSERRFEIVEE